MIDRLALDTNAVIDWLRLERPDPPHLAVARTVVVPLPVIGELYTGAFASRDRDANLKLIDDFVKKQSIIEPDERTARFYGEVRAHLRLQNTGPGKMNDAWIAALCIQHGLPLLTNDRGFDPFPGLRVVHW
jgi:tRNA(fMet)-specific endonuclease VapC